MSHDAKQWTIALSMGLAACGSLVKSKDVCPADQSPSDQRPSQASLEGAAGAAMNLVNALPTTDFPAVVRLGRRTSATGYSLCSGTFVSDTVVLTAAHCLDDSPNGGIHLVPYPQSDMNTVPFSRWIPATKARNMDQEMRADGEYQYDLAVVYFKSGYAEDIMPIAGSSPATGASVEMVGFGRTDYVDSTADKIETFVKRSGTTLVVDPVDPHMIAIGRLSAAESEAAPLGEKAIPSNGDSGGPLLHNDELVGTAVAVRTTQTVQRGQNGAPDIVSPILYTSLYADLNWSTLRDWLEIALLDDGTAEAPAPSVTSTAPPATSFSRRPEGTYSSPPTAPQPTMRETTSVTVTTTTSCQPPSQP